MFRYLWSGLMVLIGIYLNLMSKNREKWDNLFRVYYLRLLRMKQKAHVHPYETDDSYV